MSAPQPIDESNAWASVLSHDASADGSLVYAVKTTGIYCRPSCPSRRPNRANVSFFASADEAEAKGFRACARCHPDSAARDDASIGKIKAFIDAHASDLDHQRLTLGLLGEQAGLSPSHLQRKFKAVVGVSPAEYIRALRDSKLKTELRRGTSVSRATYEAGFASSSSVYTSANRRLGMTPATYRRGGRGMEIEYVIARTSLGVILVAATAKGVCAITIGDDPSALEESLSREFPEAQRRRVSAPSSTLGTWLADIIASVDGERSSGNVPLDVEASAFQLKVWRELQKIPFGETRSYSEIAAAIGSPTAARAVATACANNRVAVVVPCHRVVRTGGSLGGYRWGLERKKRLLEREKASRERPAS